MPNSRLVAWPFAMAFVLWAAAPAAAIPVFAHRYGLSCESCHTTVPALTAFGREFMRSGFHLPGARGTFPIAVKVNLAYSSDADAAGLPKAIVDEVELLSAGTIGSSNYFLEQYAVDGGTPGKTRDAWLQMNKGDLHLRAGEFTLPLPVDPETQRPTLAHYLLYDQSGPNDFSLFEDRAGADAFVDDARSGWTAHAAAISYHGFNAMLAAAKSFRNGWTVYAYDYQGRAFYRQGFGVELNAGRLDAVAVVQPRNGGFAQMQYAFSSASSAVLRYDRIYGLGGSQYQTVLSAVTRPARNVRFTLEDVLAQHQTLGAGLLFAY